MVEDGALWARRKNTHCNIPLPSPPAHLGDGGTVDFADHSSGVFAAPMESEWNGREPFSSRSASFTRRWRLSRRCPANDSEMTTTLKCDSSSFRPWDSLMTSRCVGAKLCVSTASIVRWRGPTKVAMSRRDACMKGLARSARTRSVFPCLLDVENSLVWKTAFVRK